MFGDTVVIPRPARLTIKFSNCGRSWRPIPPIRNIFELCTEWATNSSAWLNERRHIGRVREKYHANANDSPALSPFACLRSDSHESGCDPQQPAETDPQ